MSYYVIEHARGSLWWDGARWQRKEKAAKVYRHDELPRALPTKNNATEIAEKTDLRWRIGGRGGALIASAWPTLMRVDDGRIDYGPAPKERTDGK